jgi:hypothetical protein
MGVGASRSQRLLLEAAVRFGTIIVGHPRKAVFAVAQAT